MYYYIMVKKLTKKAFTSGFEKNSFLGSAFPQMYTPNAKARQKRLGVKIAGNKLKEKKSKRFPVKKRTRKKVSFKAKSFL